MPEDRELDIVLFGATGFTGALTASYLARQAPPDLRWALAGRNMAKLETLRERLAGLRPELADLPLVHADVTDPRSLAALAASTRVVASTVGPYLEHGEPLVAACAEAGTDYVDLTGEPEFVDAMYVRHHATAVASGARLVHACGFDSVPHDLGVRFTVLALPEGVPLRIRGMLRASGSLSGGTLSSAVTAMSRPRQMKQAARDRRRLEPRPQGRRVSGHAHRPHRDPDTGWWLLPLPTIDPLVVRRSAAALDRYGPDFCYAHYAAIQRLPVAVGGALGVGALALGAQLPPVRDLLLSRIARGEGPSEARRARSWFSLRLVGEGGGRRVETEVAGGDPGYEETATMLAESAMCLALDDNPPTAGQVTPATAMGEHLTARLTSAGIRFTLLSEA